MDAAVRAKQEMNAKEMFIGCCVMSVQYAKLTELHVKPGDTKSRDFTAQGANAVMNMAMGFPMGGPVMVK